MRRPVAWALAVVLAVVVDLAASGCVSLPRGGTVHSRSVQDSGSLETLVDFTPTGPRRGSTPIPLVDHFLTSMTATPLNTYVAREFLTSATSSAWQPERGTVMYGSQQLVLRPGGDVVVRLRDVTELDARGTWLGDPTSGRGLDYRLHLVKEGGQWRIAGLPNRLLIPRPHFDTDYGQFLLYFFDRSAHVLVPEPVYVPRGTQAPTLLVSDLLRGPEPGLSRADRTFFPSGTSLDGISVPVSANGTAEVPLSAPVLDADNRQLNRIFAQVAWTLGQVPGIRRIRVTVGGTPIALPSSPESVDVSSWSEFDPSVRYASTALFGLRAGRVVAVEDGSESRISGPFGALPLGLRSIGVDLLAAHVAGVSGNGHRMLEADRDGVPGRAARRSDVRTVLRGGTDLLRPAYDVEGQLWMVDRTTAGAEVMVARGGKIRTLSAPGLRGSDVRRFLISRDGTRLVADVRRSGRDQLVVSRIERDTSGRVLALGAAAPIAVPAAPAHILDIGWRTPSRLAVLTAPTPDSSQVLLVKTDGSSTSTDLAREAELYRGRAVGLAGSPARGTPLYLRAAGGELLELRSAGSWVRGGVRPGLAAPTFVG